MNVAFEYLYRDAGNYKLWKSVIFQNRDAIKLDALETRIRAALIEGGWFVAEEIGIPPLKFETYDPDLDHGWHEFRALSETEDEMTCANGRDIKQVIEALEQSGKTNFVSG